MASTSNVTPVSGSSYFGQTEAKAKGALDMSTFLNLLVTQLQNQNPLEPMDDAAFYGQMAQLGQVQGMEKLNSSANLEQAQALMGKTITAVRPTTSETGKQGEPFTGTVAKIVLKSGTQYLGVQEANGGIVEVKLDAVQSVLPTNDAASYSNLIGKTVAGTVTVGSKEKDVLGTVKGVGTENGQIVAHVEDTEGKLTAVPVKSLYQIAG